MDRSVASPPPPPQPQYWPPYAVAPPPAAGPAEAPARTSLILGIVGGCICVFFWPLGFIGVVLGILAVRRAKTARDLAAPHTPPGPATGGRVLGWISIAAGTLGTLAIAAIATFFVVGISNGWFDLGEEPRIVACEGTDNGTEVTIELDDGDRMGIDYWYTVEVRDERGVIVEQQRSTTVYGTEREVLLVPIDNGVRCTITTWGSY
jgi:hypothetical protein